MLKGKIESLNVQLNSIYYRHVLRGLKMTILGTSTAQDSTLTIGLVLINV